MRWESITYFLAQLLIMCDMRAPLTGEELCRRGRHQWPLPKYWMSTGETDPTHTEEASLDLRAQRQFSAMVEYGIVQFYVQKGTQNCLREGCIAHQRVYREISVDVMCGGTTGEWKLLIPERDMEIDSYPQRGESPVLSGGLGTGFKSSVFAETASS